jgi:hypothetical protein
VRFFTSGQEADLAETLVWAYEHRADHAVWVRAARDFAVRYSWQERVVDYRALVDSLVSPSTTPQAVAG